MTENQANKIGIGSYIVAGLGFIPGIGILFAIAAIILGLIKFKSGGKMLIALGAAGLALSMVIYGSLFYKGFVERGGIFDELRHKMAQTTITDLVRSIEYYKVVKGKYPETLLELKNSIGADTFTIIYDTSSIQTANTPFFYQLSDDKTHYYLLSVGADQTPFTSDDVLPNLPEADRVKTGLLIKGR